MPKINLLPWRETERKRKKQEFVVMALGALAAALFVGVFAKFQIQSRVDHQNERNQYIKTQIAEVDREITEIQGLEAQKARLRARIDVIDQLQRSRPGIVHLFDQLVRTLPDGVHYTAIRQNGTQIQLNGMAQSATRVSALMRNVDESEYLAEPVLEKIEAKGAADGSQEFSLSAKQAGTPTDEPVTTKRGTKPVKKAGVAP
jgi:type IV pilus assembly protein PilN